MWILVMMCVYNVGWILVVMLDLLVVFSDDIYVIDDCSIDDIVEILVNYFVVMNVVWV